MSPDLDHGPADPAARWEHARSAAFQAFKADRHDEAEALLLEAVRKAELPDADPVCLVKSLQELALLYHRLHRHAKIEATLTRLLAVQEEALGSEHPDLAGTLQSLAWEIGKCGQVDRAEALYRRALAIVEASHGPRHPYVAGSLRVLAVRLFFTRRYDEAIEFLERALRLAWSLDEPSGRTRGLIGYEPGMTLAAVLRARGKTREADARPGTG